MDSPLALVDYCFPVVQVVANPNVEQNVEINDIQYDAEVGLALSEDGDVYQVSVEISSLDPKNDEKINAYSVNLVALGHFQVHPDWPEPEKLARINGASILYSAAREFLITITSRGPWGAISLPTKSFNTLTPIAPDQSCKENNTEEKV